jgi:hypothetical protein
MATMSENSKPFSEPLMDCFAVLGVGLRAALASPILDGQDVEEAEKHLDPDFKGWLRGDPMVTRTSASRYDDDAPGFMTRSGYGSLEIGASDE